MKHISVYLELEISKENSPKLYQYLIDIYMKTKFLNMDK